MTLIYTDTKIGEEAQEGDEWDVNVLTKWEADEITRRRCRLKLVVHYLPWWPSWASGLLGPILFIIICVLSFFLRDIIMGIWSLFVVFIFKWAVTVGFIPTKEMGHFAWSYYNISLSRGYWFFWRPKHFISEKKNHRARRQTSLTHYY